MEYNDIISSLNDLQKISSEFKEMLGTDDLPTLFEFYEKITDKINEVSNLGIQI